MHVVVVGGGWAGLAAAVELCCHGVNVTLLEAAPHLGGRARSVAYGDQLIDNGQHLLLGAYRDTLRLLQTVGVTEAAMLQRQPLHLLLKSPHQPDVRIRCPALPAPLHLIAGVLRAEGLTMLDRLAALPLCRSVLAARFKVEQDISVAAWLAHHKQPSALIRILWQPLCLAILNTPVESASAHVFIRVLKDAFARQRDDSDLLFSRVDLGSIFPMPAQRFIETHGGAVILNQRVKALRLHNNAGAVQGVTTTTQEINADHVILAVPPVSCQRLLEPHAELYGVAQRLAQIRHEPICTVYVQYPPHIKLEIPMIGLLDTTSQWVFDRGLYGLEQAGLMAVVISGPGEHMTLSNPALSARVVKELGQIFTEWPTPIHDAENAVIIREKRATFSCHTGIGSLRPASTLPVRGVWLAGDYTDTGYPATLEGAVRSGIQCARILLNMT